MTEHVGAEPESGGTVRARVAVIPPIPGHDLLDYALPAFLRPRLHPGARVLVPLGKRQVTGIVIDVASGATATRLRDVLDVLDDVPLLSPDLITLYGFAARYYMASLGEVLSTAVLAGLRVQSHRTVRLLTPIDPAALSRTEREIVARLSSDRPVRTTTLARAVASGRFYEALAALAERGLVAVEESRARSKAQIRYRRVWHVVRAPSGAELEDLARRAKRQFEILSRACAAGERGLSNGEIDAARDAASLRALVARGLLRLDREEHYRTVVAARAQHLDAPLKPNTAQQRAIDAITRAAAERRFEPFLLRGITGSGKTEVYLRAAKEVLDSGRGVLLLVPEIALTHDLVQRVIARFAGAVALLHSALSPSERFDEWRRLSRREARILVGVRSAVFAPLRDVGLVIIDEEHDGAYKQEDGLRYNARDLAIVRARDAACPVVLGSATPSIESHWNAVSGRYRLLELPERVERRPLPTVEVIDLRVERPEGEPPLFAPRLRAAIVENLAAGDQTLLFLNRRGYAHYLQCTLCGYVLGCPNCSVTLTFHLRARRLRCHHCDYGIPAPELCPDCSGPHLRDVGVGTEQVETAVRALVPTARIARMDRDTVARKGAGEALLAAWSAGEFNVLVGTQMIAKGHDVAGVTLVGVVASDQTLNFPDFRSAERTFQTLTQVAGRAGRGDRPGRVLVQTHRPTHYAVQFAAAQDFPGFAREELRYREALGYPPYARLVNLRFDGLDGAEVERRARDTAARLRERNESLPRARQVALLGPAPAPIERLRGRFRWQLLVKGRDARTLQALIRPVSSTEGAARSVRMTVDVDPYGML